MLKMILNVIWLIFCGLWMAVAYAAAGLLAFLLIITIPFGIAAFRIAGYVLWPFGRTIDRHPQAGVASVIGNVLWIILFGWWLALGHLISGVMLALTIIGIPSRSAASRSSRSRCCRSGSASCRPTVRMLRWTRIAAVHSGSRPRYPLRSASSAHKVTYDTFLAKLS